MPLCSARSGPARSGPARSGPALMSFILSWLAFIAQGLLLLAPVSGVAQLVQLPDDSAPVPDTQTNPQPGARANVHGVVVNAATGEPLPRALVRLTGEGVVGTLSDGEGRYTLAGVPLGSQQFEISKPGFLDPMAEVSAAAGADPRTFAHTVVVAAGMPDVNFQMAPANSIHGQVQLSTGDVAEGIEITLLRQSVEGGRLVWQLVLPGATTTRTNADGAYRFGGLADGTYVLYTAPAMDTGAGDVLVDPESARMMDRGGYASQFYPDARDVAGAAKIVLHGGEQVEANFSLTEEVFHAVVATVSFPSGPNGPGTPDAAMDRLGQSVSAMVTDGQGHQLPYVAQYYAASQTVQALVPDGNYVLVAMAGRPMLSVRRVGAPREEGLLEGAIEISVAGHALNQLHIALANVHTNPVQVNLTRSTASASSTGGDGDSIFLVVSQTGGWINDAMMITYATGPINGPLNTAFIAPGSYWIHTNLADKRVCESSLAAGGTNLAREPLILGVSGSAAPLTLNLRDDCARLTVSLPAKAAGTGVGEEPFYTVYAVPDFDSTTDVTPLTLRFSTVGSMTLTGLTPGRYRVYVFEKPVALAYHNRAALDALPSPQTIDLAPSQTSSLVLEVPEP